MAYRITADAEMLALTTPADLESFFRQAGWDLRQPKPDGWEISLGELVRASEATGQTILWPPLNAGDLIPAAVLAASAAGSEPARPL